MLWSIPPLTSWKITPTKQERRPASPASSRPIIGRSPSSMARRPSRAADRGHRVGTRGAGSGRGGGHRSLSFAGSSRSGGRTAPAGRPDRSPGRPTAPWRAAASSRSPSTVVDLVPPSRCSASTVRSGGQLVDGRGRSDDRRTATAQRVDRRLGDQPAVVEDDDLLEQRADLADQVGGQHDRARHLRVVGEQRVVEEVPGRHVHAQVGLVEDRQRRPARQSEHDTERGLLAARQLLHLACGPAPRTCPAARRPGPRSSTAAGCGPDRERA